MVKELKSNILYHRSYRKLQGRLKSFLLQFLLFAVPLSAITIFFYPQITHTICQITENILAPIFLEGEVKIAEIEYINAIGNISFIQLPSNFPTFAFSMINAIVCLAILILIPYVENSKPAVILVIIISSIQFISALFFLIFPLLFPYQAVDYSRLYMIQQISIWFFVPILMGLAVLPLPSSLESKFFTLAITYIYSLIFGTVRYVVFLFILGRISLLYMAVLFFLLGPLIDFVYIVGAYSIHVTRLANKIKGDFSLWKWQ